MNPSRARVGRRRRPARGLLLSLCLGAAGLLVALSPPGLRAYSWGAQAWLAWRFRTGNPVMVGVPLAEPAAGAGDGGAVAGDGGAVARDAGAPAPAGGAGGGVAGAEPARAPDRAPGGPAPLRLDHHPGFPAMRLEVPAIQLRAVVVRGVDFDILRKGPGHYPGTPYPGEAGNAAIAGHRSLAGAPAWFYRLDRLQPGDRIRVVYPDVAAEFTVESVLVVAPTDVWVLAPTPEPALTLTTCDPPGTDRMRLVVRARLTGVGSP